MMPELTVGAFRRLLELEEKATPAPWEAVGTAVTDWDNEAKTCTMEFIPNRWSEKQTDDAQFMSESRNALRPLLVALCEAWLDDWLYAEGSKGWDCRQHTRGVLNQGVLTQDGYWLEQRGWEKSE